MKKAFLFTAKLSMFIMLACLAINIHALPIQTTEYTTEPKHIFSARHCYSSINSCYCTNNTSYITKLIHKSNYSVEANTENFKEKQDTHQDIHKEPNKLKNYIYIKGGVARTKYNKFKEGESNIYITKNPNIGYMYTIGIGHTFTKSIRSDLSLQYGKLSYKGKDDTWDLKQKIKLFSIFANGYYDIPFKFPIKINSMKYFLTAGLGIGHNKTGDLDDLPTTEKWEGKNTTNFIWNIGAGIKFNLTKRFTADLGYRYLSLGTAKVRNNDTSEEPPPRTQKITAHQIMASLIFNF